MDIFTVSLFGHRQINDVPKIEKELEKIVCSLLLSKEYVEFLIGRRGEFDILAASVIRRCQRKIRDDNSSLILILPYVSAEVARNETFFLKYYDEIEVCLSSSTAHFKAAYQNRNKYMVERSELVIFYVCHASGGAYQTLKQAQQLSVDYINLSSLIWEDSGDDDIFPHLTP